MRIAFVSDLHANLQAWNAVLLDIRCNQVDRIICLGDCVGYGPHPAEVLQSVHETVHDLVLGNHDAVVCGKLDGDLFNEQARAIIQWTRSQLNAAAVDFLASLPLTLAAGEFRCAHGEFSDPAAFRYLVTAEDALPSWAARLEPLLFVGHTHQPAVYVLGRSGTPHRLSPQDFQMEPGKRYLVNVGSVGQPRDGEPRASYCIYDTQLRSVYWRRTPFDLDAYRNALRAAGLPEGPSYFLRHDPRQGVPPLRQILNFSPPLEAHRKVRNTVEVQVLHGLERKARLWRRRCVLAALLALLIATGSGTLAWRHATRRLVIQDPSSTTLRSAEGYDGRSLTVLPPGPIPPGQPIPGWTLTLGDKRRQSARIEGVHPAPSAGTLLVQSRSPEEIRLSSGLFGGLSRRRVSVAGEFRKSSDFEGTVALVLSLIRESESGPVQVDQFLVREPNLLRRDGWVAVQQTTRDPLPASTRSVQLHVRGQFTGTLEIRDLQLIPRPAREFSGDVEGSTLPARR